MKKLFAERNLVVFLFIVVLIVFSFAERDSQKLDRLYAPAAKVGAQPQPAKASLYLPQRP